jgi:hypothetical protein
VGRNNNALTQFEFMGFSVDNDIRFSVDDLNVGIKSRRFLGQLFSGRKG